MKLVFTNMKLLYKKTQVNKIKVPAYDELSVKNLWPQLRDDPQFNQYFPDNFPANKAPSAQYFYDVLHTMYPDYLDKILKHAAKMRHTIQDEDQKLDAIKISDEWLMELQSMPFTSGK